jgi:acyl-CoA reductase-like NAD-dependent aldehyde dehydrogenase
METLNIPKTIKLFINGEFPRTESGRSFACYHKGTKQVYANLCLSSRKDLRSAVTAAKDAQKSWSEKSAYNRSQILYRMAEMAEGKRHEFSEIINKVVGSDATKEVNNAIDSFVYYSGWCDKYQQVMGAVNPVSGPHHNFTTPESTGVVALICDDKFDLGKIVADISAIISSGNTVVVILPETSSPLLAVLAETLATSDLPKGVVNLLSGSVEELASHVGSHMEIQSLCYRGSDPKHITEFKTLAIENMKRFVGATNKVLALENILDFVEYKTVWHPIGN